MTSPPIPTRYNNMLRRIYKLIPVPVIATKRFIPARFTALSLGVAVLIRPEQANDKAMIAHELTHCRQFYRTLGFHALLYWLSKRYRYQAELEAYRVQNQITPNVLYYARMLAKEYGLDVGLQKAQADIEGSA